MSGDGATIADHIEAALKALITQASKLGCLTDEGREKLKTGFEIDLGTLIAAYPALAPAPIAVSKDLWKALRGALAVSSDGLLSDLLTEDQVNTFVGRALKAVPAGVTKFIDLDKLGDEPAREVMAMADAILDLDALVCAAIACK